MPASPSLRSPWLMLMALTCAFALSQAFRTVAALMAPPLQQAFGLSAQQLGLFAGVFHFAFGALQLFMGMGIDVYGVRRTVLAVFPLAIVGALITANASGYGWLLVGQALTGIGCAPAFLVCTVFIARQFPPERFAAVSGATLGIGSAGLLLTGTPLAWIIEAWSWRAGFQALAACAALAWLAIWLLVREPAPENAAARPGMLAALRGLWLGPMLIDRHGFTLVQTGNVALAVSLVGMAGPPLFGRLDPGDARRRGWIMAYTVLMAAVFALMAIGPGAVLDVGIALFVGLASGYMVMQYADVKAAYPASMTGRAMAVFTMAMFLGVALMQWLTGLAAMAAEVLQVDPYAAVLGAIAAFLLLGTAAFRWLPQPRR